MKSNMKTRSSSTSRAASADLHAPLIDDLHLPVEEPRGEDNGRVLYKNKPLVVQVQVQDREVHSAPFESSSTTFLLDKQRRGNSGGRWENNVLTAHLVAIICACAFGGLNVVTRVGLADGNCDPLIFGFFRILLAALILLPIGFATEGRNFLRYDREDWGLLFLCGVFGVSLNIGGFCLGVEWTSADIAALYQPLSAVFAALVATLTGLEKCGLLKFGGIFLAVTGVAGATLMGGLDGSGFSLEGNLALMVNTLGMGMYCVAQKPIAKKYSALKITCAALIVGGACMFLGTLAHSLDKYRTFAYGAPKPLLAMAYTVLVCSCFCYTAQSWCCKHIDASIPVLYMVLQPLTTGVLAYFLLDEDLGLYDILGDLLICIGLVVCTLGELGYGPKLCSSEKKPADQLEEVLAF